MSLGLVVVEALVPRGLWALWHFAEARLARALSARVGAAHRTGQARLWPPLGEDFSAYSPRATLRTGGEAPYDEFPRRGRLTIRSGAEDLEYYLKDDDIPYVGEPDPDECHVGVELSEGDSGHVDYVAAYDQDASLFDPARPFVNRAQIRPGATLRQLVAAFRLTLDDVVDQGGNWHGPLCGLDGVDGLLFVVERHNGEDVVTESWLDRAIVSFDVVPSSEEEEEGEDSGEDADEEADEQEPDEQEED